MTRRQLLARMGAVGVGLAGVPGVLNPPRTLAAAPKRGGVLRFGLNTPGSSLDPHVFTGAAADDLFGMVYSRLVQISPDWNTVAPDLAEHWTVSPDNKTYTFTLRSDVKFHDGSAMTADDVVFSVLRIMEPGTGAFVRPLIADVFDRVTATSPTTVQFMLKQPYAAFLAALALPTASIVSKKWVAGGGNLNVAQMGTGPMKFVSLEPNVKITLARHAQYFESGLPYLDGMSLLFLADDTARSTALRNGSVDFIEFVPYKDMAAIMNDPHLRFYGDATSSGLWAFPNVKRPPLDNVQVRQAINWAANRDAVLKAAFFGQGALMDSVFMPKTSWAYVSTLPKYGYDPDRAKDLIKRSGIRLPAKLEILTASNVSYWKAGSEVLQANLQDLGFDVQLVSVEFAEAVRRFYGSEYQITMWGGGPAYGDPDFLYTYFHSHGTIGKTTGYVNTHLEGLLERARITLNRSQRKALYEQAYKILLDDAPWFPLVYREQAEASADAVQGYRRTLGSNWNGVHYAKLWLAK